MAKELNGLPPLKITLDQALTGLAEFIDQGNELMEVEAGAKFDIRRLDSAFRLWKEKVSIYLGGIFDDNAVKTEFDLASVLVRKLEFSDTYVRWDQETLRGTVLNSTERLLSIQNRLQLRIGTGAKKGDSFPPSPLPNTSQNRSKSRDVFVVHGHDESAKESTARLLEKAGLNAIILHERPDEGKTIIEKLEKHGDVAFAVVLLTPDDVGSCASGNPDLLRPRARQNVVLELGYFIGSLGRANVRALYKGDIEPPSDVSGVLYIPIDSSGAWRIRLLKEIKAAGVPVDIEAAI